MKKYTIILFGAICAVILAFNQNAKADFISFLDSPNDDLSGLSGPFGKVDVHLTSTTTATVTFTSLTNNGNIYLFGDGSTAAVNVNATTFTITGITGSNAGTGFTNLVTDYTVVNPPGTSNVDGKGSFNGVIDTFDGFTHSVDTLSFTLTNVSGTWSGAGDVLIQNAAGFDAAAHIFVTDDPAVQSNGASVTGFAGETGGTVTTPDGGATACLLGLGLAGLAGIRARFGRK
jgi:hypothetical protein